MTVARPRPAVAWARAGVGVGVGAGVGVGFGREVGVGTAAGPGLEADATATRRPPITVAAAVAVVVSVAVAAAYLRWTPAVPDLAAQVARADVARVAGSTSWWTGWFGGVSLPTYSVLVPAWMALLGVGLTGVLAVAVGSVATTRLMRVARRPVAGAVACAVAQAADVLDGRVTFAVGAALGLWTLVALRDRRPVFAAATALACLAGSPLAALFLGLGLVSVALVDPPRRRTAVATAAVLLLGAVVMAFLFPGTGRMPFHAVDLIAPIGGGLVVIIACRVRVLRITAGLSLLAVLGFYLDPFAVGENMTRLVWIASVPVVVAFSTLSTRRVAAIAVVLSLWPGGDLLGQLHLADAPSTAAAFYRPVRAEILRERARAGATGMGQRVEVVDTANHWGSAYLSSLSLARGWDRQVDQAANPIFYEPDALTMASYRVWLRQLAVGWVALPAASYDYASVHEAALVQAGLPYLALAWSSPQWRLYRVVEPAPLVTGARLVSVGPQGIAVSTTGAATVDLRVRWSAYLRLTGPAQIRPAGCVFDRAGWVRLYVPRAGTVTLTSNFDPRSRLVGTDGDCVADLRPS